MSNKEEGRGPAARRRPRKPRKIEKDIKREKGKDEKVTFTSVQGRDAAISRSNIMVVANCVPKAVEAAFCALASRAYTFGQNIGASPVYFGYVAFMQDLIQLMGSQIPASSSRLDYLNDILGSFIPKTIPFKTEAELSYSWGNVNTVQTANSITIRNKNYYFYVDDGSTAGNWLTQSPPSNPANNSEAFDKLAEIYSVLAKKTPGLTFDTSHTDISPVFKRDVSAYSACAPYYGSGNGENGPAFSCENESAYLAPLLSGIAVYDRTRIARNFKLTSGDTTTSFGLPFIPGFEPKFYKTCYAPIYKFIDIDEFILLIQYYYISLVSQYYNTVLQKDSPVDSKIALALSPFDIGPNTWRVFWRQIILSMFPASQGCSQFITYSSNLNGFEPLRVSSNCYPPVQQSVYLPTVMIENLRMLQPKVAAIKTKFQSEKNALLYIPVFGVYKSVTAYNQVGTFYQVEGDVFGGYQSPICIGVDGIYPDIIDGTGPSSEVLNMNSSSLAGFVAEWNYRITTLKAASATTSLLGGSSNGSLLTLTRYAYYNDSEVAIHSLSKWEQHIGTQNKHVKSRIKEIKRTVSQKTVSVEKESYYVPDNYDLFSQRTQAISSLHPMTEQLKVLAMYMVLPSYTIEADQSPPLQRQIRILSLEGHVLDYSKEAGYGIPSQASDLENMGSLLAPGLAAHDADEIQKAVDYMNTTNQGGWIGDALTELAKVVLPNIPF